MAYYTNLLNMGEPVSVEPLPQPLLTSPFNYTDTGLLPINIPSYAAPTPQPYTPIEPGPFGVQPVAPVAPVRRSFDTNAPTMEDIEAELGLAGTVEPTAANIAAIAGNLASFATGPFGFALGLFGNMAANRNTVSIPTPLSLLSDLLSGDYGGFDGKGGYGTGGVDAGAFNDAVTTAAFDNFGAAFDGPGTASWSDAVSDLADGYTGVGPDEGDESGGYGDYSSGDYSDSDDGGFGDNSDW